MDRERAYTDLTTYTKSDSLIKHALGVEAAMRAYARKLGEDEDRWGVVGLIHDFDYELHPTPEEHPEVGSRMLEEMGYPSDIVYAVRAHGDRLGLPRNSSMDKALYAVDELVGFVLAVAYVRPSKSVTDVEVSSVKKKMKDKAFARAVSREDIVKGADELGVSLDDHIGTVIGALREIAADLGME